MSLRRLCPQLLIVPLLLAGSPAGQCAAPGAPPAPPRYVAVADFSVPRAMAAAAALAHRYAAPDGTKLPALASETSSAGTPRADAPAAPASGAGWLLPALLGLLGLLLAAAVAYLLYASWRDRKTPGAVSRAFSTALRGLGAGTAAAILAYQAAELVFRQIL
ncbi:MAG: hypothetical protein JNJ60_06480, partial [Rhodocyclaceae bacterium]|nr:hypothetical protein [Rhodocyclaceae bacterium]